MNALKTCAYAAFGTGSEAFEPKLTEPADELGAPRGGGGPRAPQAVERRTAPPAPAGAAASSAAAGQPLPCRLLGRRASEANRPTWILLSQVLRSTGSNENRTRSNTNAARADIATVDPALSSDPRQIGSTQFECRLDSGVFGQGLRIVRAMLAGQRQKLIVEELRRHGAVRVSELTRAARRSPR